jgi:hypothetical protein
MPTYSPARTTSLYGSSGGTQRTYANGSTIDPLAPLNLYNQTPKKAPSLAEQMAALNQGAFSGFSGATSSTIPKVTTGGTITGGGDYLDKYFADQVNQLINGGYKI